MLDGSNSRSHRRHEKEEIRKRTENLRAIPGQRPSQPIADACMQELQRVQPSRDLDLPSLRRETVLALTRVNATRFLNASITPSGTWEHDRWVSD